MPIWGQALCLGRKTKRQQAAALQTLRAYQRPLHPLGPYGDRHVVWAERQSGSKLPHSKRFAPTSAHSMCGSA